MLKVFGALMLFCGCTGIGLMQANHLNKRIKILQTLIYALEVMERELSFRIPMLEEILSAAARSTEGETKSFLSLCVSELNKKLDYPFYEIWNRAAHEHLAVLKKSDFDPVMALGSVLGRYDSEGQRTAIGQTRSTLVQILSDAKAERCSQGKVYKVLSATAGAFLTILLL